MLRSLKTLSVFFLTLFLFLSCESSSESSNNTEAPGDTTSVQKIEEDEETSNTCGICARTFYGNGYEEQMDGSWTELEDPYESSVCSPNCGRKSVQELNDVAEKYGIDMGEENSNTLEDDGYHTRRDGRIYENKKCGLCKGTGVESARNFATREIESRICPMCEGRGIRSY
jgi:hypothetical protein